MNAPITEVCGQLKVSGQVTLDANGNGVLLWTPDSARQRWVVTGVNVATNQASSATVVPVSAVALNTTAVSTLSAGNSRGASWSGNQDTFAGQIDVGPCDQLSVLFYPPPGQAGAAAALAGVIASAVVTGQKYTRRA